MAIKQYYETTLIDNESDIATHVVSIPKRSYKKKFENLSAKNIFEHFDFKLIHEIKFGDLTQSLAYILAIDDSEKLEKFVKGELGFIRVEKKYYAFAEYIVTSEVVPFENSPLSSESFGNIASGGATALGATIGYIVAGPTPMLFISVPAGILICGAAIGVSNGLQKGLRNKISKFIEGK